MMQRYATQAAAEDAWSTEVALETIGRSDGHAERHGGSG